jgi:adenosylmethionine-8-amino-7-oxononanoate aminotransferase
MSGPGSGDELVARDLGVLWHPYAPIHPDPPPVPVRRAEGVELELVDGRRVVDGMSSWWAAIHGYNHPVLNRALADQAADMAHVMFGGLTHAPAVELGELLVALTPPGLDRVFLCDSGSVAVEVAIKMAMQHWVGRGRPERTRLLTVRGGYHGDTFGAMAVCDPETGMHHLFTDLLPQHLFAPIPQPPFGEPFLGGETDELAALLATHRDTVAAVILEPIVQGAGGMRFYAPEYLAEVRRLCDEHDVLLIADEIATGFGRSGRLFACEHAGVTPDILCLGKALTGGYLSMAATLCTDSVAEGVCRAEPGALMHGPTFMANPLAAAVALASVRLLLDRGWVDDVARIERRLEQGLASLAASGAVADVRVLGAIGVVEMVEPVPMGPAQVVTLDHGVWLRPFGRLLYTMPPFITSDADVDRITAAMGAVVDLVAAGDAPH